VSSLGEIRRFNFGAAVVCSLRELSRFFRDESRATIAGGFRNPDSRSYDIHRCGKDYRLVVSTGNDQAREEFQLERPEVFMDREFLQEYDGHQT
jgi:hypothetical protein